MEYNDVEVIKQRVIELKKTNKDLKHVLSLVSAELRKQDYNMGAIYTTLINMFLAGQQLKDLK